MLSILFLIIVCTTPIFIIGLGLEVYIPKIITIICAVSLVTPLLTSFLDALLCLHRLIRFYGKDERNFVATGQLYQKLSNYSYPLSFILMTPFLMLISFLSILYQLSENYHGWNLVCFITDNGLKFIFSIFSFIGYLSILMNLHEKTRNSIVKREDSLVIRQALPIASFQLMTACVQCLMELPIIPYRIDPVYRLLMDLCFSCACSIVVPLSILFGSTEKRKIFLSTLCCCCCCPCRRTQTAQHQQQQPPKPTQRKASVSINEDQSRI
ncbi:unnamed protein product [Caenorhabditis angaria]|uniref:Uncharacterized protein n=1 Tax=Caenorhabditis angaria TaxID=860376 RepID=A0A9P1I970_9PELO|nr:unnamed protein product [Caenorhabditis angaria]